MKKYLLCIFIADILVMAFVFGKFGFFDDGIDTSVYVNQMKYFAGKSDLDSAEDLRNFKPFYGIMGAPLLDYFEPYTVILIFNIAFFIGLSFAFYFLLKELRFGDFWAFFGTLWLVSGYPMLKYGFSLGTDISGWFFSVASILSFLAGIRTDKKRFLFLSGLLAFLGFSSKETGVLGLIFAFIYALGHQKSWGVKKCAKFFLSAFAPFAACETVLLAVLVFSGSPTFLDWYSHNILNYRESFYRIFYFFGVELSAFNILFIFLLTALMFYIKNKEYLDSESNISYAALFASSIPVLFWPIFISRIIFTQFLFFIPFALFGIKSFLENKSGLYKIVAVILPVAANIVLINISEKGSLFEIFKLT